jgi:hypothetical protein
MALKRKPHKGERIVWASGPVHTVLRTPEGDDNICHIMQDGHDKSSSFIWRFTDGLNQQAVNLDEEAR